AAQAVEERRLAGAVRADETDDRAALDIEREPVEGDDAAEADGQLAHSQQGGLHRAKRLSPCSSRRADRACAAARAIPSRRRDGAFAAGNSGTSPRGRSPGP